MERIIVSSVSPCVTRFLCHIIGWAYLDQHLGMLKHSSLTREMNIALF